jgi:hypothetical protein
MKDEDELPLNPESSEDLLEAIVSAGWLKAMERGLLPPLVTKVFDSTGEEILKMTWDADSDGLPQAREDDDVHASTSAHFPLFLTVTDRTGESFTLRVEGPKR